MINTEHGDIKSRTRITHTVYWTIHQPNMEDVEYYSELVPGMDIASIFRKVYNRDFIYSICSNPTHLVGIGSEGYVRAINSTRVFRDVMSTGYIDVQNRLRVVFDDLVEKGILPAGDYIIYHEYDGEEG